MGLWSDFEIRLYTDYYFMIIKHLKANSYVDRTGGGPGGRSKVIGGQPFFSNICYDVVFRFL